MLVRGPASGSLLPRLHNVAAVVTAASAFHAFSTLPLAQVCAILFGALLLITLLSLPIPKERAGLQRWSAVAVGFGMMAVLQIDLAPSRPGHPATLAAGCNALAAAVVR